MKVVKTAILAAVFFCAASLSAQNMGMVTVKADPRIEHWLRLRVENNSDGRRVDGYVIQIYYGRLQKARDVMTAFQESYPFEYSEIEYDTPDYKVFVGAYLTEAQAREALSLLKQNPDYSGAFVRPKKITVYDD